MLALFSPMHTIVLLEHRLIYVFLSINDFKLHILPQKKCKEASKQKGGGWDGILDEMLWEVRKSDPFVPLLPPQSRKRLEYNYAGWTVLNNTYIVEIDRITPEKHITKVK